MKNLIIVGASDWGTEVFSWLDQAIGYDQEWVFKGFLDDNKNALDGVFFCNYKILSDIDGYVSDSNDVFLCAIGNPKTKKKIVQKLEQKKASFINIIHRSVITYKNISLGTGIVLAPNVVLSHSVEIGDHCGINIGTSVGHHVKIGAFSQISSHCDLTGHVALGQEVFLGSSVALIPGVVIGDRTSIGAGSVVIKKAGSDLSLFGNPAKRLL